MSHVLWEYQWNCEKKRTGMLTLQKRWQHLADSSLFHLEIRWCMPLSTFFFSLSFDSFSSKETGKSNSTLLSFPVWMVANDRFFPRWKKSEKATTSERQRGVEMEKINIFLSQVVRCVKKRNKGYTHVEKYRKAFTRRANTKKHSCTKLTLECRRGKKRIRSKKVGDSYVVFLFPTPEGGGMEQKGGIIL